MSPFDRMSIEQRKFDKFASEHSTGPIDHRTLLNTNISEYGKGFFLAVKEKDYYEFNNAIAQVTHVRNLSIPAVEDEVTPNMVSQYENNPSDFLKGRGPSGLMKITLSDGDNTATLLDLANVSGISSATPPGTKVLLNGKLPYSGNFILLHAAHKSAIKIIGGTVDQLLYNWKWSAEVKVHRKSNARGTDGPPMFVAFGHPNARAILAQQRDFLNNLLRRKKAYFDSFAIAHECSTADKESSTEFSAKRSETIAQVKSDMQTNRTMANRSQAFTPWKNPGLQFQKGGSKFYELQNEKMGQHDHLLANLLQMGYPENISNVALKICQNDLKATIDYINKKLAKPAKNEKPMDERTGGNLMKRGGRNRRGRGFDDESPPEMTQPRPKQLVVNLSDLMNNVYLNEGVNSRTPAVAPPVKKKLAYKTPILAESFDGSLQPAILLGLDQKSSRNGENVVQIIYESVYMQEVVPLALIRNVQGQKIELDELPIYRDPNEERVSFNRSGNMYQQNESNTVDSYDRQQRGVRGGGGRGRGGNFRGRFNRGRRGRFTRHQ